MSVKLTKQQLTDRYVKQAACHWSFSRSVDDALSNLRLINGELRSKQPILNIALGHVISKLQKACDRQTEELDEIRNG